MFWTTIAAAGDVKSFIEPQVGEKYITVLPSERCTLFIEESESMTEIKMKRPGFVTSINKVIVFDLHEARSKELR